MAQYIILSKFPPEAFQNQDDFKKLACTASARTQRECPDVRWKDSFAIAGRYDVVDIIEADDPKQIEKAAILIRTHNHPAIETRLASDWKDFLSML